MAIGLIKFRSGKKGKAVSHYNYAMHEKNYSSKDTADDKAVYKTSGNMPSWAKDNPRKFWQMGDKYERDNGTTYREHILPLPRELNLEQQVKKVDDWISKQIGDKHPYSYAIHYKQGKDGKLQPHAHLFWSERTLDGIDRPPEQFFNRYNKKNSEKGGCQKASLGMSKHKLKKFGQELSKEWRIHVNKHLEINGIDTRIDELSNREKGLAPKPNISYVDMQKPEVEQAYVDMLQAKAELQQSEHDLSLIDWDSELSKLQHEQNIQSQLDYMLSFVGEIYKDSDIKKWLELSDNDLVFNKKEFEKKIKALFDKAHQHILTDDEISEFASFKDVIATVDHITTQRQQQALEQQRQQAEQQRLEQQRQTVKDKFGFTHDDYKVILEYAKQDIYNTQIKQLPPDIQQQALAKLNDKFSVNKLDDNSKKLMIDNYSHKLSEQIKQTQEQQVRIAKDDPNKGR